MGPAKRAGHSVTWPTTGHPSHGLRCVFFSKWFTPVRWHFGNPYFEKDSCDHGFGQVHRELTHELGISAARGWFVAGTLVTWLARFGSVGFGA